MKHIKIKSIKKCMESYDKYDLEVEDTHNFFANDILVHNCRCLAQWDGSSVKLISRGNKTYDVPNVQNDLAFMFSELDIPEGVIFDGELYRHGMEFADISGACKKLQDSTDRIQFHIYDIFDLSRKDMKFSDRYAEYIKYSQQISSEYIRFVITYENTPKEFDTIHDDLVEQGFEGLIIRHPDLPYKLGKRSQHLLKYKKFEDEEFKIVDVISGEGKFENKAIFVCSLGRGSELTFNVVAKGTDQERESYLTNRDKYIGEMMTVKFFGRSEDNIPRFPVGKGVRIKKDMS